MRLPCFQHFNTLRPQSFFGATHLHASWPLSAMRQTDALSNPLRAVTALALLGDLGMKDLDFNYCFHPIKDSH